MSFRMVGLSTGQSLTEFTHPSLSESATQTSKAIEDFGVAVEQLLIKYGKGVIGKFCFCITVWFESGNPFEKYHEIELWKNEQNFKIVTKSRFFYCFLQSCIFD